MVRAKFMCVTVTRDSGGSETVKLTAVADTSEANKQWAKWTPYGELVMQITNPDAQGRFDPGKYYYLDLKLAEE